MMPNTQKVLSWTLIPGLPLPHPHAGGWTVATYTLNVGDTVA